MNSLWSALQAGIDQNVRLALLYWLPDDVVGKDILQFSVQLGPLRFLAGEHVTADVFEQLWRNSSVYDEPFLVLASRAALEQGSLAVAVRRLDCFTTWRSIFHLFRQEQSIQASLRDMALDLSCPLLVVSKHFDGMTLYIAATSEYEDLLKDVTEAVGGAAC